MLRPERIETAPALRLIGLTRRYTHATRSEIPDQWAAWDHAAIVDVDGDLVYGVSHGFGRDGFDYTCALPVSAAATVPPGQVELRIDAARYAVFVHFGHVSGLAGLCDEIVRKGDPGRGLQFAPGPMLEVYGDDFDGMTATGRVELWFPVAAS